MGGQNIVQLAKGSVISPAELTGIEATAVGIAQRAKGHNAIIIYFDMTAGSGTWSIKLQGAEKDGGTYIDMYKEDGNAMAIASATADKAQVFKGIPEHFRIVATEDVTGATVSVRYELLSI